MKKRWRYWMAGCAAIALVALAFRPARQFHRFFLTECAAGGPVRETELEIHPPDIDLSRFYAELRDGAEGLAIRELAHIDHAGERWPILLLSRETATAKKSMLVVAGIHGNEVSGSLSALALLRAAIPESLALHVLAPANPVGLQRGSRYNAQGCDINRDFERYRTVEARAIRDAVERSRPAVVIALHEGPQDGVFIIGTLATPTSMLDAATAALQANGFTLARENNLGLELAIPGMMIEGSLLTRAKRWLGIHTLGEYTTSIGVPLVTTETPWRHPSLNDRIEMQRVVFDAIARDLAVH